MNTRTIEITFAEDVLGSLNNNPNIFEEFQTAKIPPGETAAAKKAEETLTVVGEMSAEELEKAADEKIEKQTTVFPRNTDGKLTTVPKDACFCFDYQWRGFFKEALQLGTEIGADEMGKLSKWTIRKAVDSMVFIAERRIPFMMDGKPITSVKQLERPLRAMTQRGERICLARSEIIPAGATLSFTLKWLENKNGKSTQKITEEALVWALDYGSLKGFGQWRGGGFGRFTYKIIGASAEGAKKKKTEVVDQAA